MADESKPAAPAAATKEETPKAKPAAPVAKVEDKDVMIMLDDSVKSVIAFGGFPRLFLRPGPPTLVATKVFASLQDDVGYQKLLAAKKISILA